VAAPENTVAAFRLAAELGADGVELDVRRTADGQLAIHHDATLAGVGPVCERTLAELREARPELSTLEESLDACAPLLVNIEIKNFTGDPDHDPTEMVAGAVVDLLHRRGGRDRVLVSSFSLDTIDRVRALDPGIPTGFLTLPAFDPVEGAVLAAGHGHGAVHPFVLALAGDRAATVVEQAHALDVAVNVWTVNDPVELARLAVAGVDALITDVPDVARQALA
jgi:glycerophosphoryl diester phosphodiesterase